MKLARFKFHRPLASSLSLRGWQYQAHCKLVRTGTALRLGFKFNFKLGCRSGPGVTVTVTGALHSVRPRGPRPGANHASGRRVSLGGPRPPAEVLEAGSVALNQALTVINQPQPGLSLPQCH